jgi:5-methylcytosine-specific restriction enzyme A
MNTYLMTWNPRQWEWVLLEKQAGQTARGHRVAERWSCGNTKKIQRGDRLFLLKQGHEQPRGIMASGWATSFPHEDEHWDKERAGQGGTAIYVDADWDTILNPAAEDLLPTSSVEDGRLPTVHWNTQKSGITIPEDVARELEALWAQHVRVLRAPEAADVLELDDEEEQEFPEGRVLYRLHRYHGRRGDLPRRAKALALKQFGRLACVVCTFDFFEAYGELGKEYIECHHTVPVSQLKEGTKTKVNDLVLVCSNCHRMLHRCRPWLGTKELKFLLRRANGSRWGRHNPRLTGEQESDRPRTDRHE